MDSLTQSAARMICSLFWFVPFVWTAYSHLYLEQEKACDMGVIDDGVERCEYAACVLDAVRLSHQTALFAGLFFSGGRKRILEERIHHIIKGGNTMKKCRLIFIFTVLAACAFIVLSGAAGKKEIPNEEAWAKITGVYEIKLKKSWTDENGSTFCQYYFRYTDITNLGWTGVGLIRVDESGTVLEMNTKAGSETSRYPEEINPGIRPSLQGWYHIYHRE